MAFQGFFSNPHHLFCAIFPLLPGVHSWTYPAHVDLAYPPIAHSDYINETTPTPETYPNHDLIFKCDLYPVDENTPRVRFPITSGHIGLNISNSGTTPPPGYYTSVQWSIGQVSNLNLHEPLDSAVADSGEQLQDFTPRQRCSTIPVNATERILTLFGSSGQGPPQTLDITGWNATIEADISLSTELGDSVEQMYQCGYVTFVSQRDFLDEFGGYCGPRAQNPGGTENATTTTLAVASSTATAATSTTASAMPTTAPPSGGSSGNRLSGTDVGLIIGFSTLGFIVLLGAVSFWWYRRRLRRAQGDVAFALHGGEEQPPTYVEATEKTGEPALEKKESSRKLQDEEDKIRATEADAIGVEGSSKRKE